MEATNLMETEPPVLDRAKLQGRIAIPAKKPSVISLTAHLSKRAYGGIAVVTFMLLAFLWWLATKVGFVEPIFLPSPDRVLGRLYELADNGVLWEDAQASFYRIAVSFVLASLMAIPVGVIAGSYRVWAAVIEPIVDFVRYMPVVAFVPLTILWTGTGDVQKFLIIWLGTFFQQVLMVMDAVKRVPSEFIGLGRTLGLPDRKILWKIVIPCSMPAIWDTLRISLGWAWTWLVLAELVAATTGLGYRIVVSQRFFQTDTIIGYILMLGLLGLITDQVMKALEKVLFGYLSRKK